MTAAIPRFAKFGAMRLAEFRRRCVEISRWSLQHAVFLGGLGAIAFGFHLIWHPLGFIVGGWFAIQLAVEGEWK